MSIEQFSVFSTPHSVPTPKEIVRTYQRAMQDPANRDFREESYSWETQMFLYVKNGDEAALEACLSHLSPQKKNVGRMSNNSLRQAQYSLVSGITLMTRYAIAGGLTEAEAYNLSDAYLLRADEADDPAYVMRLFAPALRDFTHRVHVAKTKRVGSYPVAQCIRYIGEHLHSKITLADLARHCNLTPQYLSALFRKETGHTVTAYIQAEKLSIATQMLEQSAYSVQVISSILAYATPAAFTVHFKEVYGVSPSTWRKEHRGAHATAVRCKENAI